QGRLLYGRSPGLFRFAGRRGRHRRLRGLDFVLLGGSLTDTAVFTQDSDHGVDRGGLSFLHTDLGQHAGVERFHFHVGLIGLNLRDDVTHLDLIPDLFEPPEDLSLLHRVTQTGHNDVNGHVTPPLLCQYNGGKGGVGTPPRAYGIWLAHGVRSLADGCDSQLSADYDYKRRNDRRWIGQGPNCCRAARWATVP